MNERTGKQTNIFRKYNITQKNINKAARMKLENTRLRKRSHCKRVQTT